MKGYRSNFKLGQKIGSGYFGEVFVGQDDVHGEVAVKVLRQAPQESDGKWAARKEGLLREGQNLGKATHDNVVQVHHLLSAEGEDAVHLLMEHCKGGSLQAAFERGPMRLSRAQKIATEVALGLHALHARGLLHRDIKPGNVLLTDNYVAKLGDFGLVTDDLVLGYGSQVGYADHIPPEVWNGGGTSVRSDIWAFGMTLYRLLHGVEWYSRLPQPQCLVPLGGYADKLHWLPHIPKRWRRVIRKLLHDDPQLRYQDANQVINALATLATEPDWACSVTANEVKWQRRINNRRIRAFWRRHSERKYEWAAWSEPIDEGRRRSFGRSSGAVGRTASETRLREFFATYER